MKRIILAGCIFLLAGMLYAEGDLSKYIYITENYPPINYVEDGEVKGGAVEILKLVWEKLGIDEQKIEVYPWSRAYRLVLEKPGYVLFSVMRTDSRENLFKWAGPISEKKLQVIGLKGSDIRINSIEDMRKYKIGVVKDDISEIVLIERGFSEDMLERAPDVASNVKKLKRKRVNFICHTEGSIQTLASLHGIDHSKFEVVIDVAEKSSYFAFNVNTPESAVADFQKAFDSLEKERKEIIKKYGMD